jgi:spore coat protein SA
MYLHAATYEPFGLVLLEAMAAGLPIVSYDGQGNRDIIEDGKNGFILTSPTPKEFANKIIFLLTNKIEYETMSEYAKLYAKKFDIDNYCINLLTIYQKALQEKIQ